MWPQIILTVFLIWLCLMQTIKHTIEVVDKQQGMTELIGGELGIIAKYATMFACLYYGGFYKGVTL